VSNARVAVVNRTFVQLTPLGTATATLVCLPWAGAGAFPFRAWRRLAPAGLAIWAARLPGREDRMREPPVRGVRQVVREIADDLPPGPFHLFGHCLGALLALEVARERRRRGSHLPARLLVVGKAPARMAEDPPVTDVRAAVRASGTMSEEALDDPQIFQFLEPAFTADFALAGSYRYEVEPPMPTPVDVFVATEDRSERPEDLRAWSAETSAGLTMRPVTGRRLLPGDAWDGLAEAVLSCVRTIGG
jgi:surfactin synthase thioesterase subunit